MSRKQKKTSIKQVNGNKLIFNFFCCTGIASFLSFCYKNRRRGAAIASIFVCLVSCVRLKGAPYLLMYDVQYVYTLGF